MRIVNWFSAIPGFPCPGCGSADNAAPNLFCAECAAKLPLIIGRRCSGCGGKLDQVSALCHKCLDLPPRLWEQAVSVMEMSGFGREMVLKLKNGRPELARTLAHVALPLLESDDFRPDVLVPIPLHWTRQWTRGYNQSELLCRHLSHLSGIPCDNLLKRPRRRAHQAAMSRQDRFRHLKGLFALNTRHRVEGLKILLVDDVFTTGATFTAAALLLPDARVRVLSLARR